MSAMEELGSRVRAIASEVENNIRGNPDNPEEAGWGQFVDAQAHYKQIGPYGTAAGLLLLSVSKPQAAVDQRAIAQVETFWRQRNLNTKLFRQNVRLAFLVLSLAKTQDPSLVAVRDAVVNKIRGRQLPDGAWGDWYDTEGNNPSPGRPETTAWVVLALSRVDANDPDAMRAAEYLQQHLKGTGQFRSLSAIGVAAALSILPRNHQISELRERAHNLIRSFEVDQEEHISFFDYVKPAPNGMRMARDYLCFPAFYSLSLLVNGLLRGARRLELLWLTLKRMRVVELLTRTVGNGHLYKLPGARFAATVDQAMIALAYEQLAENPSAIDPSITFLRPKLDWVSESWIFRAILPVLVVVFAIVTLESPKAVPEAIGVLTGWQTQPIVQFAEGNDSLISIMVDIIIVLFSGVTASAWRFTKRKLHL